MFIVDGEICWWFEGKFCFFRGVDGSYWIIGKVRDNIVVIYIYIYLKRIIKYSFCYSFGFGFGIVYIVFFYLVWWFGWYVIGNFCFVFVN